MIGSLLPYPSMRDSGVAWLAEIPAHWDLRRTKAVLRERAQKGFPDEPLLAATQTKGVVRKEQYEHRTVLALKDLELLKLVRVGDFVISLRSFQGGIEYAREQGIISPAYTVLYTAQPGIHGYLAWLFKSAPYVESLSSFVTGIRQGQNIDYTRLGRSTLPFPPLPEQAAIVHFLDHTDGRIRRYIRAKQKLIALLGEQKQAIIHRAVTRGLDPEVRLKQSGVEWLGEVPEHWEVRRLKTISAMRSGDGITSMEIELAGNYPVYGGNGVRGFTTNFTHDGERALIGRQGALCGNVHIARGRFWASEHAVVVTLNPGNDVRWFAEVLRVMNLNQYSVAAAQPGLAVERVLNLYVPVPPAREQKVIADHIAMEAAVLDGVVTRTRREIGLLREYRTRLIADVVTGKIDVREAAMRLPDVTEPHAHAELVTDEDLGLAEDEDLPAAGADE